MISKGNHVKFARFVLLANLYIFYTFRNKLSVPLTVVTIFFFRSVHGKIIIRFGFCDILNNQGGGRGYQLKPSASAENPDNPYREKYAHVS